MPCGNHRKRAFRYGNQIRALQLCGDINAAPSYGLVWSSHRLPCSTLCQFTLSAEFTQVCCCLRLTGSDRSDCADFPYCENTGVIYMSLRFTPPPPNNVTWDDRSGASVFSYINVKVLQLSASDIGDSAQNETQYYRPRLRTYILSLSQRMELNVAYPFAFIDNTARGR